MRILVASESHGDPTSLDHLRGHDVDVIAFCGDLVHAHPRAHAKHMLEKLRDIGPPVFIVPGNVDPRTYILELYDEVGVHGIHDRWATYNGLGIMGYGGAYKPGRRHDVERFHIEDWELGESLRSNYEHISENRWQMIVTHQPPLGTVDLTFAGVHAGSRALREFIEEYRPTVVVSGHIHEARGTDRINDTLIVNPGPLFQGYFAIVNLNLGAEAELLSPG